MAKYTEEVKQKAVAAAKEGMALKEIQRTIGPNPKAVLRYLVKAGVDYNKVKEELRAAGKLAPATRKQGKAAKKDAKPTETVIEE